MRRARGWYACSVRTDAPTGGELPCAIGTYGTREAGTVRRPLGVRVSIGCDVKSSTHESKISGAEDPSAMSERLATVGFHTSTSFVEPSFSRMVFFVEVISSIEFMKVSEARPTPMKSQRRKMRWPVICSPTGHKSSASVGKI